MTFRILWTLARMYIRDTQGREPGPGERIKLINNIRIALHNQKKGR